MRKIIISIVILAAILIGIGLFAFFQSSDSPQSSQGGRETPSVTPNGIDEAPAERPNPPQIIVDQTLEEQLAMMKEAIAEAERLQSQMNDPQIYNWLIRTVSDAKTFDPDITDEELIAKAIQEKKELEQFIAFAASEYHISFSETEVDEFIKEHLRLDEQGLAEFQPFAELMEMTVEEFLFEFERDRNTKLVVWTHLLPLLEQKYAADINKAREFNKQGEPMPLNVNALLQEKYEIEIKNYYE